MRAAEKFAKAVASKAKAAPTIKQKRPDPADLDHRRWCVEQAMRWPVVQPDYSYAQRQAMGGGYMAQIPAPAPTPDILARAQQIYAWTTS